MKIESLVLYNLDNLRDIGSDDNDFMIDILKTIIKNCPDVVTSIDNQFQSGNMKTLSDTLHKFKSTVHVLSNQELYKLIGDSESMANQQTEYEKLKGNIEMLKAAIPVLSEKLSSEIRLLSA